MLDKLRLYRGYAGCTGRLLADQMIVPAALKLRQAVHETEAVSTMLLSFPMTNNGMEDDRVLSIDGSSLTLEDVERVAHRRICRCELGEEARAGMEGSRGRVIEVVESGATVYGVNTGFGHFGQVRVDSKQIGQLQLNLVRSHATGVGRVAGAATSLPVAARGNHWQFDVCTAGVFFSRPRAHEQANDFITLLAQEVRRG